MSQNAVTTSQERRLQRPVLHRNRVSFGRCCGCGSTIGVDASAAMREERRGSVAAICYF